MNKEININDIVKIEQMPIIFSQLEVVGKQIDEELAKVKNLEATEENKQEVKKVRTNINNTLKEFEERRKFIKNKILEDYNTFNDKYESEVKIKLQNASDELKAKIDDIENEQLKEKTIEIIDFINEHIRANHLDNIINSSHVIELTPLKINLSTSLKSLKEDALKFIEKVANEIKLIELEETPSNLLYEYKNNGFDLTKAKLTLIERQKQIEELAKQREQAQEIVKEEEKVAEVVEEIVAPKQVVEDDVIYEVSFKIHATKEQIKQIKNLLIELGVEYE